MKSSYRENPLAESVLLQKKCATCSLEIKTLRDRVTKVKIAN